MVVMYIRFFEWLDIIHRTDVLIEYVAFQLSLTESKRNLQFINKNLITFNNLIECFKTLFTSLETFAPARWQFLIMILFRLLF